MKKVLPTIVILILIGVLGTVFYRTYYVKYSYSAEKADVNAYYGVESEDDYPVILQDQLSDYHAKKIGEHYYLDLGAVKSLINDRFYYSEEDIELSYCLPETRVYAQEGSQTWKDTSGNETTEEYAICVQNGEILYVALDFVAKYSNFSYETFSAPNRMRIYTEWGERQEATVTRDTSLRVSGGVKSAVVAEVPSGTRVVILDKMDTWCKVETEDALIGYIENRKMTDSETVTTTPVTNYTEPAYKRTALDGKVNMAWHMIAGAAGNATLAERVDNTKSINVIAPTWFSVLNESGSVDSRATQEYVDGAHQRDMQVWAVLDNFNGPEGVQQWFLASAESRNAVISSVMDTVKEMGIDGVNVDIEGITEEYGEDYIEFIRELSIECRKEECILSVDNYVPYNFNDHYRLDEQGVFADYVVVMGYDEHYAGSQEAGSYASIDYVTYGIEQALNSVPADKLINGIPFYTRIWKTTAEGVSSEAYGMDQIQTFIANHNMEVEWNASCGQNYAEVSEDDATYQIWVEDAESVEKKLEVMDANGIIGVAEWCLGMESSNVWDVIAEYMNH
jgi:spore germination protein YaaH